jgi:hypothetical protein
VGVMLYPQCTLQQMGLSKEPVVITADVRDGTATRLLILSPDRPELGKSVCALVRAVQCRGAGSAVQRRTQCSAEAEIQADVRASAASCIPSPEP